MTDNIFNHAHTNEEKKSQKFSESTPAEELFIKQKDKIKHYKEMLERENKIIYKNDTSLNQENEQKDKEISNDNKKVETLEDFQFFETTPFSHNKEYKFKEHRIPVFKTVFWKRLSEPQTNLELKNLRRLRPSQSVGEIFLTKNESDNIGGVGFAPAEPWGAPLDIRFNFDGCA